MNIKEVVDKYAHFAISAHNVQPFDFQLNENSVEVLVDPLRFLPAADPKEKDLRMSFGALFETLSIAASNEGFELKYESTGKNQWRIEFKVVPKAPHDLYDFLSKRFSFRGAFKKQDILKNLMSTKETHLFFNTNSDDKMKIAKKYDEVNVRSLMQPGYIEELYSWLRFSRKHKNWAIDGLNTEAIALNSIESFAASSIMQPKLFRSLSEIVKYLIPEEPKIMSAPYLVAIAAPLDLSEIECGRLFLRSWLQLTELNLFGNPLSILTDFKDSTDLAVEVFKIPNGLKLVNVIRCGLLPEGYQRYQAARRSVVWR